MKATTDYSVINQGQYPVKPYFSSRFEKVSFLAMTAVDIAVVGYILIYMTYNGGF